VPQRRDACVESDTLLFHNPAPHASAAMCNTWETAQDRPVRKPAEKSVNFLFSVSTVGLRRIVDVRPDFDHFTCHIVSLAHPKGLIAVCRNR
jgi:hypothetical protein